MVLWWALCLSLSSPYYIVSKLVSNHLGHTAYTSTKQKQISKRRLLIPLPMLLPRTPVQKVFSLSKLSSALLCSKFLYLCHQVSSLTSVLIAPLIERCLGVCVGMPCLSPGQKVQTTTRRAPLPVCVYVLFA